MGYVGLFSAYLSSTHERPRICFEALLILGCQYGLGFRSAGGVGFRSAGGLGFRSAGGLGFVSAGGLGISCYKSTHYLL